MEKILQKKQNEPTLRLNIASVKNRMDFLVFGEFSIVDNQNQIVMGKLSSDLRWRAKLEAFEPAQFIHAIKVHTTWKEQEAERIARELTDHGFVVKVQPVGGRVHFDDELILDNTHYEIHIGEFNSYEDALSYTWKLNNKYDTEVIREKIREPRCSLEIFDAEYERSIKVQNSLALVPSSPSAEIVLWNRNLFESHHRFTSSTCNYSLPVELQISDTGEIMVLCEITVEDYIEGVLSLVMGDNYPLEALKSQAVTSRTLALARLNLSHPQEPYDLCSDAHCQLFNGISDGHPKIAKAVSQTRGEVLFYGDKLYETPYTTLCGGYTENRYISDKKQTALHIQGIWDGPTKPPNKTLLSKEEEITRWITSCPPVYCNPADRKVLEEIDHIKTLFRWEISYPRKKLEEIISRKTGQDIGTLFDIVPLKRGSSGRLKAVEILGSRKNLRIKREYNIRHTLSDDSLNSSCFVIEKDMGENGIPISFTFIGAGYGHGVGLCQAGAAVMASEGKSHTEILRHYFADSKLKKIYN